VVKEQQKDERAMVIVEPEDSRAVVGAESSQEVGVIRPVGSAEEVLAAWQQFQDVKRSLLTLDDYQEIQGRARIKKSGWRKIAAAFGISDQILCEERREHGTPGQSGAYFVWEIRSRAVAPNGRYVDAVGSCASNERRFSHVDHDVRAVAHTRSKNRAVADLVGGGEVSAEEIEGEMAEALRRAPEPAYGPAYERTSSQQAWPREPGREPSPAAAPAAPPSRNEAASAAQLRNIRAHLQRTRTDEAALCARAGVAALEELTRGAAADLLKELSRQPNAA
jgi:hypothetical protein